PPDRRGERGTLPGRRRRSGRGSAGRGRPCRNGGGLMAGARGRPVLRRSAVLLSLLLVLAACTGGGDGDGRGGGPASTAARDVPGTIVVASGRDVTGSNGVRQQLIDAWNLR